MYNKGIISIDQKKKNQTQNKTTKPQQKNKAENYKTKQKKPQTTW